MTWVGPSGTVPSPTFRTAVPSTRSPGGTGDVWGTRRDRRQEVSIVRNDETARESRPIEELWCGTGVYGNLAGEWGQFRRTKRRSPRQDSRIPGDHAGRKRSYGCQTPALAHSHFRPLPFSPAPALARPLPFSPAPTLGRRPIHTPVDARPGSITSVES